MKKLLYLLFTFMVLPETAPASAQKALARIGPMMFQVITATSTQSEKSEYGTGFVINRDGQLMTNFHVVATHFWHPESEHLYVKIEGKNYEARIINVDIANDLAIIKIDKKFPTTVAIAATEPQKGEEIYSLGLPENLEWSVVGGTYNGLTREGVQELFYMSAPLNGGMSGGPTVNSRYELVAVNVSTKRDSNLISFGVPLLAVRDLIARPAPVEINPHRLVEAQLSDFQAKLTDEVLLLIKRQKKIMDATVPDFSRNFKCGAGSENTTKYNYERYQEFCSNYSAGVYLHPEENSGFFGANIGVVQNRTLNSLAWLRLKNKFTNEYENNGFLSFKVNRKKEFSFSAPKCTSKKINQGGVTMVLNLCHQKINEIPGLQDSRLTILRPVGKNKFIYARISMFGFREESILKILQELLVFPWGETT